LPELAGVVAKMAFLVVLRLLINDFFSIVIVVIPPWNFLILKSSTAGNFSRPLSGFA
jgi:hypothetical protein